jgi:hypothetical protein
LKAFCKEISTITLNELKNDLPILGLRKIEYYVYKNKYFFDINHFLIFFITFVKKENKNFIQK